MSTLDLTAGSRRVRGLALINIRLLLRNRLATFYAFALPLLPLALLLAEDPDDPRSGLATVATVLTMALLFPVYYNLLSVVVTRRDELVLKRLRTGEVRDGEILLSLALPGVGIAVLICLVAMVVTPLLGFAAPANPAFMLVGMLVGLLRLRCAGPVDRGLDPQRRGRPAHQCSGARADLGGALPGLRARLGARLGGGAPRGRGRGGRAGGVVRPRRRRLAPLAAGDVHRRRLRGWPCSSAGRSWASGSPFGRCPGSRVRDHGVASVRRGSERIGDMPRPTASLRWADRTPIERVRLYTVGSLYVLVVLSWPLRSSAPCRPCPAGAWTSSSCCWPWSWWPAGWSPCTRSCGAASHAGPDAWRSGSCSVARSSGRRSRGRDRPKSGFAITLLVVFALAWGLGGMDDRRVWWALVAVSVVLAWSTSRALGAAAFAAVAAAFLVFTVRSSLWLLGVVEEVEAGRHIGAALAVAEERLRFSRDVHDVLGRRLSEIAVQAELASAYVVRGDGRAAGTLADVRATAHTALREARELARGYRPVDLGQELEGAAALLRSAGIEIRADLDGLPQPWAEPVARVVREAVTNVLRHSRATWVSISYDDGVVAVRNDGVIGPVGSGGSGLVGLGELVAPLRARLDATSDGDHFELRVVPEEGP